MPAALAAGPNHLPLFITAPGGTDWLFNLMAVILIGVVLAAGVFFFWLHSLPERMVHNKAQFDIVAVLALLSLFTHIHAFWVAALLLALVDFSKFSLPDFSSSLGRIANSLEAMDGSRAGTAGANPPPAAAGPPPAQADGSAKPKSKPGEGGHA